MKSLQTTVWEALGKTFRFEVREWCRRQILRCYHHIRMVPEFRGNSTIRPYLNGFDESRRFNTLTKWPSVFIRELRDPLRDRKHVQWLGSAFTPY